MERNPLIVVSSRLDGVRDEARGSKKSAPSIVTAWRRAKEADVGNTIVDCHDESLADEVKGAGAYSVVSDPKDIRKKYGDVDTCSQVQAMCKKVDPQLEKIEAEKQKLMNHIRIG